MTEYYAELRLVHVYSVIASGALFFARGLATQLGAKWPMMPPLRYLSYSVDIVLLTAALMLAEILQQYPFVRAWVTAKIILLVPYIVLGSFALKRGRTKHVRLACWLAALGTYGLIVSIARTRHPLGFLGELIG